MSQVAETVRVSPAEVLETVPRGGPLFVDARSMLCPRCEEAHDVLSYTPLGFVEKYAEQLVVPLQCPRCRHIFALRPIPEYEEARHADQG